MWTLQNYRIKKTLSYWGGVWGRLRKGYSVYDSVMEVDYGAHRPDELLCGTFLGGTKLTEEKFALYLVSGADRDDVPLK